MEGAEKIDKVKASQTCCIKIEVPSESYGDCDHEPVKNEFYTAQTSANNISAKQVKMEDAEESDKIKALKSSCIKIEVPTESYGDCDHVPIKRKFDQSLANNISELLPKGYKQLITSFEINSAWPDWFTGVVRLDIRDEGKAREWLKEFQDLTMVTLRISTTVPKPFCEQGENIFKCYYHCQHNSKRVTSTANQRLNSKKIQCPARLSIVVKRVKRKKRLARRDPLLDEFPTTVSITHTHNHDLYSADSLRHRDVSQETIDKFTGLFKKGHSPATALKIHKMDLQMKFGADYPFHAEDRATCPDLHFCYRLHSKLFGKAYGVENLGNQEIHAEVDADDPPAPVEALVPVTNSTPMKGREEFICPECDKIFKSNRTLVKHRRGKHDYKSGMRFMCDVCGRGFMRTAQFQSHVNRHAKLKPFQCSDCTRTYTNQESLTRHIRTHVQALDYSKCEKNIAGKLTLGQHKHTHDQIPQFLCARCGRKFKHFTNLKRHEKIKCPFIC